MLGEKALKEFQKIWGEECEEGISETDASVTSAGLVEFFQLIAPKESDVLGEEKILEVKDLAQPPKKSLQQ